MPCQAHATIADRSRKPITVAAKTLDAARARVKKDKHRLVTIDQPSEPDLRAASIGALRDAVALFREKPPRGSANNWGAKGYTRLIAALGKPESAGGWLKAFPTGRRRFAAMTTAFRYALTFWEDDTRSADRLLFAQFLEELAESGLPESSHSGQIGAIAGKFRESGALWKQLGTTLLPDEVPLLAQAREAITERHESFLTHGSTPQLADLDRAYNETRTGAENDPALADDARMGAILKRASTILEQIRDLESEAMESLAGAVSEAE